jgi:N-acetylmuramoyl-L-alanine amidase
MNITRDGLLQQAKYIPSPAQSGAFRAPPTLLVMHYTASGGTAEGDANHFANQPRNGVSAHIILGREGEIFQSVPFTNIAHHAGQSSWRGRAQCNSYSIGIEIDNWGILTRREDGTYRSWTNTVVDPSNVIKARHKNSSAEAYWETYPPKQIDVLVKLTEAILKAYPSIKDIVGHDDIAPGRKVDPGPAFPMRRFENLLENRGVDDSVTKTVWASTLNVRSGPGTNFATLDFGPLKKGTVVEVISGGEWAQIRYNGQLGWVADRFLA